MCDVSKANKYFKQKDYDIPKNNFSHLLLKAFKKIGVVGTCGIPGTGLAYFYNQVDNDDFNFLVRHEQNGGFIASGSVRGSLEDKRKILLTYATTGPGTTNLSTPVADSMKDKIPSIFLVSDIGSDKPFYIKNCDDYIVSPSLIQNRQIQDVEPEAILGRIAKEVIRINPTNVNNATCFDILYKGIQSAFSYPQGPLVIVVSVPTFNLNIDNVRMKLEKSIDNLDNLFVSDIGIQLRNPIKTHDPISGLYLKGVDDKLMKDFTLSSSKKIRNTSFLEVSFQGKRKPLIIIGWGAREYARKISEHCKKLGIPFGTTLPLADIASKDEPLYINRPGHLGTYEGNMALYNCDWFLGIGMSFSYWQVVSDSKEKTFNNATNVISLNKYPWLTNVQYITDYIIEDASTFLNFNPKQRHNESINQEWYDLINEWKREGDIKLEPVIFTKNKLLNYGYIYTKIQDMMDRFIRNNSQSKVWIVVDATTSSPYAASLLNFRDERYRFVCQGSFGPVGGSLGTSIGIAKTREEDLVICISGDAGTILSCEDLITIKEANLKNIILLTFENSGLGFIQQEFDSFKANPLKNANGYKETPNWYHLMNSSRLDNKIITYENRKELSEFVNQNMMNKSLILVLVVEYDVYYSPLVDVNTRQIDMKYYIPGNNIKFDKKRAKLIYDHC